MQQIQTKYFLFFVFLFLSLLSQAQDSNRTKSVTLSGYVEIYYSYDFAKPNHHERPSFFYSHNRHNEVNLNLGLLKASYNTNKLRANLALMSGTYTQYNLATEQGLLKNVFEANVGLKLSARHNVWIDAGIMPSHIGFESAISKDCWVLTRSVLAENSPYYEAGLKLAYTSSTEKVYLAAMYLNGWQKIQRNPGNQTPAFGTQFTYKPDEKSTFNWSTYIGNEQADTLAKWRFFNNLYAQFLFNNKVGCILGLDVGIQQQSKGSSHFHYWYSPLLIARYSCTNKIRIAARGEYYADQHGVIIQTSTSNGFQTLGYSLNVDYLPIENAVIRIEGRALHSKDKIFESTHHPSRKNYFMTCSMAVSF